MVDAELQVQAPTETERKHLHVIYLRPNSDCMWSIPHPLRRDQLHRPIYHLASAHPGLPECDTIKGTYLQVAAGVRFCIDFCIFEAAFGRRRVDCVGFLTTLRGRQQMRGGCDFKLCCCRWFFSRPDHSSTKSIWKVMQLQTAVWII